MDEKKLKIEVKELFDKLIRNNQNEPKSYEIFRDEMEQKIYEKYKNTLAAPLVLEYMKAIYSKKDELRWMKLAADVRLILPNVPHKFSPMPKTYSCIYGKWLYHGNEEKKIEKNPEEAFSYFSKCAKSKGWYTCGFCAYMLGHAYENGKGCTLDKEKAMECYYVSWNRGSDDAGLRYLELCRQFELYEKCYDLFKHNRASFAIKGISYLFGIGEYLPCDKKRAEEQFIEGCKQDEILCNLFMAKYFASNNNYEIVRSLYYDLVDYGKYFHHIQIANMFFELSGIFEKLDKGKFLHMRSLDYCLEYEPDHILALEKK